MEDVGRAPEPSRLSPVTEPTTIPTLDGWIESLMTCKQLAETDVQRLCEKVRAFADLNDPQSSRFWVLYSCILTTRLQAREVLQDESNVQPVVGKLCLSVHNDHLT